MSHRKTDLGIHPAILGHIRPQGLEARLRFDREKWQAEERLRREELSLKREELKRSRWINPLVIAIFAAAAAALGNAVVTLINSTKQLQLEDKRARINQEAERSKSEAARILEVVKTNDPDKAATNLKFLIDTGLISDTEVKKHIQAYLERREPGEGIVLPAATPTRPGIEREFRVPVPQALIGELTKKATDSGTMRWMQHAIAELGVAEIPGSDNNSRIMEYSRVVGLGPVYSGDEIPWAGLFLAFVLKKAGFDQFPPHPLLNRSWAEWGQRIEQPKFGAIAVFWRDSPQSASGHAGFVVGDDERSLSILGGNQRNSVSILKLPRDHLLALRMPPPEP